MSQLTRIAFDRGNLLYEQKRYTHALREFSEYLSHEPNSAPAHAMRSLCQMQLKDYTNAREGAEAAIAADPSYATGHYALGWALYSDSAFISRRSCDVPKNRSIKPHDRLPLADASSQEALRLESRNVNFLLLSAYILMADNYPQGALRAAEAGLAKNPGSTECLRVRAKMLRLLGDRKGARIALATALAGAPDDARIQSAAGWTALSDGNLAIARIHFFEALRLNPTSNEARRGLIQSFLSRYATYRLLLSATSRLNDFWRRHWHEGGFVLLLSGLKFAIGLLSRLTYLANYFLLFNPATRRLFEPFERLRIAGSLGLILGLLAMVLIDCLWAVFRGDFPQHGIWASLICFCILNLGISFAPDCIGWLADLKSRKDIEATL